MTRASNPGTKRIRTTSCVLERSPPQLSEGGGPRARGAGPGWTARRRSPGRRRLRPPRPRTPGTGRNPGRCRHPTDRGPRGGWSDPRGRSRRGPPSRRRRSRSGRPSGRGSRSARPAPSPGSRQPPGCAPSAWNEPTSPVPTGGATLQLQPPDEAVVPVSRVWSLNPMSTRSSFGATARSAADWRPSWARSRVHSAAPSWSYLATKTLLRPSPWTVPSPRFTRSENWPATATPSGRATTTRPAPGRHRPGGAPSRRPSRAARGRRRSAGGGGSLRRGEPGESRARGDCTEPVEPALRSALQRGEQQQPGDPGHRDEHRPSWSARRGVGSSGRRMRPTGRRSPERSTLRGVGR